MALNLVWCGGGGDVRVPDKSSGPDTPRRVHSCVSMLERERERERDVGVGGGDRLIIHRKFLYMTLPLVQTTAQVQRSSSSANHRRRDAGGPAP